MMHSTKNGNSSVSANLTIHEDALLANPSDEDDEEDDIYIRNGSLIDMKPLIKSSKPHRNQSTGRPRQQPIMRPRQGPCQRHSGLILGGLLIAVLLAGSIFLLIYVLGHSLSHEEELVGCSEVKEQDIWHSGIGMFNTESAFRLLHVNDDGVLDIIMGFGTGASGPSSCVIYYNRTDNCYGGMLAADGATGKLLWTYMSVQEMFGINCNADLNGDGYRDCVGGGRRGAFAAVDSRTGKELWAFSHITDFDVMNLYTAQTIPDVDGDGVEDLIQIHGGDPLAGPTEKVRLIASLVAFSGRTGKVIVSHPVPDHQESYISPILVSMPEGGIGILFGSGGEVNHGNFYLISLSNFLNNRMDQAQVLVSDDQRGFMTPSIIVDITGDGVEDIIVVTYNNDTIALDGVTFKQIWKYVLNTSETYVSPSALFFNDDDIPDIVIQRFVGPGYPVYYYGVVVVLDGRTGRVLDSPTQSNNVVMTSPITLASEGRGNDLSIFWVQHCRGHEDEKKEHSYQNIDQHIQSRAMVCKLKYNTTTSSKGLIWGRNIRKPGVELYTTDRYYHIEREAVVDAKALGLAYVKKHPKYRKAFDQFYKSINEEESIYSDIVNHTRDIQFDKDDSKEHHMQIVKAQREKALQKTISLHDNTIESELDKDPYHLLQNGQKSSPGSARRRRSGEASLHREKRHVGQHDAEGLMRIISTGTLAPPLLSPLHPDFNQSMDYIFATYWNIPMELVLQTPKEIACNKKWSENEKIKFESHSKFKHYDHDHYLQYGALFCAKKYGSKEKIKKKDKRKYFNIHFGVMTIYRKRLTCTCPRLKPGQRCAKILPLEQQPFVGYLGNNGDGYWNSKRDYNLEHRLQTAAASAKKKK